MPGGSLLWEGGRHLVLYAEKLAEACGSLRRGVLRWGYSASALATSGPHSSAKNIVELCVVAEESARQSSARVCKLIHISQEGDGARRRSMAYAFRLDRSCLHQGHANLASSKTMKSREDDLIRSNLAVEERRPSPGRPRPEATLARETLRGPPRGRLQRERSTNIRGGGSGRGGWDRRGTKQRSRGRKMRNQTLRDQRRQPRANNTRERVFGGVWRVRREGRKMRFSHRHRNLRP
ncbi:hypothetical protein BHE74_00021430 [Ensete ventricosum]|nr:hypothetical protein BHE74_00021430 [Ensete ventricosum]